eukprot:403340212
MMVSLVNSSCRACTNGFLHNDSCLSVCPAGYYGETVYSIRGMIQETYCEVCNLNCRECVGAGSNQCTQCFADSYLSMPSTTQSYGSCLSKTDSTSTVNIYVEAPVDLNFDPQLQTGDRANPFSTINDALVRAYEDCATVITLCTVNIYLLKGDHYVLRTYRQFYRPLKFDQATQNIKMTIMPFSCSIDSSDSLCVDTDAGEKVTIYNKLRERFQLFVGAGLTLQNIIIDSLDSIVDSSGDSIPDCLKELGRCCEISQGTFDIVDYGQDSAQICDITLNQPSEVCNIADGGYFIKFDISTVSQLTEPPTLTIDNCEFTNYLFDFNSFIETNKFGGHIIIKNSVFDKFSSCGSIVRNYYHYFEPWVKNRGLPLLNYQYRLNELQQTIYKSMYNDEDTAVDSIPCNSDCFSLTISDTEFINFGHFMRNEERVVLICPEFGMQYHGKVIQVNKFDGPIKIENCLFEGNILGYQGGFDIFQNDDAFNYNADADEYLIYSDSQYIEKREYLQTKHLIAIQGQNQEIILQNNRFSGNSVIQGTVFIQSRIYADDLSEIGLLVYNNTFESNFAYYGTSGLFIRRFDNHFDDWMPQDTPDYIPCGAVTISNNIFSSNFGAPKYGGSAMKFHCEKTTSDDILDRPDIPLLDSSQRLVDDPNDSSVQIPYDFSDRDITLQDNSLDPNKIEFSGNIYQNNYASNNEGVLDLRGLIHINLMNETFRDNGENLAQIYNYYKEYKLNLQSQSYSNGLAVNLYEMDNEQYQEYMTMMKLKQASSEDDEYDYTYDYYKQDYQFNEAIGNQSLGCIYVRGALYINIDTVIFENNFLFDLYFNNSRGSLITINELYGYLSIVNTQMINQNGMQSTKIFTDVLIPEYEVDLEYNQFYFQKVPLIGFDSQSQVYKMQLEGLEISNQTFYNDQSNQTGMIIDHYDAIMDIFFMTNVTLNGINCRCNYNHSLFSIQAKNIEMKQLDIQYINKWLDLETPNPDPDNPVNLDLLSNFNYKNYNQFDSSLYSQVFQLMIYAKESAVLWDFFQESTVSNLVGNTGALFNISFAYENVTILFFDSDFQDIDSINGGLIHINDGLGGFIYIQYCNFTRTYAYGNGGVVSVNNIYTNTLADLNSYVNQLWFLGCYFTDNYLESISDIYHYFLTSGYIAFVNQNNQIDFYLEESFISQPGRVNDPELYDFTLEDVEKIALDIKNYTENIEGDETYGTAFVISTLQQVNTVNSYDNQFTGCRYGHKGSVFYIGSWVSSDFNESYSTYSNNYANYGGNIYCYNCLNLRFVEPIFDYSQAFQGGVFYFEVFFTDQITAPPAIQFSIELFTITNIQSFDNGGFLYFKGDKSAIVLDIQDTIFYNIWCDNFGFETTEDWYYNTLNNYKGGGVFSISSNDVTLTIKNSIFEQIYSNAEGGIFLMDISGNNNFTITNSTFLDSISEGPGQMMFVNSKAGQIYGSISDSDIQCETIFENLTESTEEYFFHFTQNLTTQLNMHAFYFTTFSNQDSDIILTGNTISNCIAKYNYQDEDDEDSYDEVTQGGVFYISGKIKLSDQNSTYINNAAMRGAIYNCDGCSLNLYDNTYTDCYCQSGCIVYSEDIQSLIADSIEVYNVTAIKSASLFYVVKESIETSQVNISNTKFEIYADKYDIYNVDRATFSDTAKAAVMQLSHLKSLSIETSTFTFRNYYYTGFQSNSLLYLGFDIKNVGNIEFTTVTFQGVSSQDLTDDLNVLKTKLKTPNFEGLISIQSVNYMYFVGVTIQNIAYLSKSAIYIQSAQQIHDNQSVYMNNYGVDGAVFNFNNVLIGQFTALSFSGNYGNLGGVMQNIDNSRLNFNNCKFTDNHAVSNAGVLYHKRSVDSETSSYAEITFTNCTFNDNSCQANGGVMQVDDKYLKLTIQQSAITKSQCSLTNNIASGGVIYGSNFNLLLIQNNQITDAKCREGSIMTAIAANTNIKFYNNIFKCQASFNQTKITEYLSEKKYLYKSAFTLQNAKLIDSVNNTYTQCGYSEAGGVYYFFNTEYHDANSLYQYNGAVTGGAIQATDSIVKLTKSTFKNNNAFTAGVIQLDNEALLESIQSTFSKNKAIYKAGVINLVTKSSFKIYNSSFFDNYANEDSVINVLESSDTFPLLIKNSRFYLNNAEKNTIQLMYVQAAFFEEVSFEMNIAKSLSKNLFIGFSNLTINNSRFIDDVKGIASQSRNVELYNNKGAFLHIIMNVNLTIENTVFENGYAKMGGALYIQGESMVSINNTNFINSYASQSGGAVYALSFDSLILNNTKFTNNYADIYGADLYGQDSISFVNFNRSTITSTLAASSIYFSQINFFSSDLTIQRSNYITKQMSSGGAISCFDCGYFWVYNMLIQNSSAVEAGGISLEFSEQTKEKYTGTSQIIAKIVNSKFVNCISSGGNGGGIHIHNIISTLIQNSSFINNWAVSGGGFYFQCSSPYDCSLRLSQKNNFINNSANVSGGAFYWSDVKPKLDASNVFVLKGNTAEVYADNIGSYPQKLVAITSKQYEDQQFRANPDLRNQVDDDERRLRHRRLQLITGDVTSNTTQQTKDNQRSGDQLPTMYLALADEYGQIVGTESSKKLDVGFKATLSNTSDVNKYAPQVSGVNTFYSSFGVYKLSNITFTGAPGNSYSLSFVSEGIDNSKPANVEYLETVSKNSSEIIEFTVSLNLRECAVGEKFSDSGSCDSCPEGKSFSLVVMKEPGICRTCPTTKAVCNGGSNIGPQPGYWRKSNTTSNFIKCFNTASCLGMIPPKNNPQGECDTGYQGILCADCQPGYSITSSFKCGQCPEFSLNLFRIIAIFILVVVVIGFMIRSTMKGAADTKNITSVFQKILLNHIQLIVLTASFDFNWPEIVLSYFKTNEAVGEASSQIFSVDCFLNNDKGHSETNLDYQKQESLIPIRIFYFKLALFGILPFILVIISYTVWGIRFRKPHQKALFSANSTSSIVILLFLVHPNIVKFVFNSFNCIDIDGDERVKNDLEIQCYQGQHSIWTLGIALPAMIVWGLGIPLFAFVLLTRSSKKLELLETKQKFGFLYRGYKMRFYYWETAMTVLLMLILFMSINLTKSPFITVTLNQLESISIVSSILTIFCGIFFIVSVESTNVDTGEETSSSQVNLTDNTKLMLFLIILTSNLVFFLMWIIKMIKQLRNILIKKLRVIYTLVCLCGNNKKYQDLLVQIEREEDNQILREKYSEALRQLELLCDNGELQLNIKNIEKLQFYLRKDKILSAAGVLGEGMSAAEELEFKHAQFRNKRIAMDLDLKNQLASSQKKLLFKETETEQSLAKSEITDNFEEQTIMFFQDKNVELTHKSKKGKKFNNFISFTKSLEIKPVIKNTLQPQYVQKSQNLVTSKRNLQQESNVATNRQKIKKFVMDQSKNDTETGENQHAKQKDDHKSENSLENQMNPLHESQTEMQEKLSIIEELVMNKSKKRNYYSKSLTSSLNIMNDRDIGLKNIQDLEKFQESMRKLNIIFGEDLQILKKKNEQCPQNTLKHKGLGDTFNQVIDQNGLVYYKKLRNRKDFKSQILQDIRVVDIDQDSNYIKPGSTRNHENINEVQQQTQNDALQDQQNNTDKDQIIIKNSNEGINKIDNNFQLENSDNQVELHQSNKNYQEFNSPDISGSQRVQDSLSLNDNSIKGFIQKGQQSNSEDFSISQEIKLTEKNKQRYGRKIHPEQTINNQDDDEQIKQQSQNLQNSKTKLISSKDGKNDIVLPKITEFRQSFL